MSAIVLGKGRGAVALDAARLVGGCALIQGTRGSGKSYATRVIVEQTIASFQTIILDPEGEYPTLREHYDILIAGPGGDVPCDVRTAGLLARRVAELGVSTVVDMSRLEPSDQEAFVASFVAALNQLPTKLERSRLLVIDEAHRFVPETGKGSSVAGRAIKLLMSQGRKRGLGAILVTQRLSKLAKDAAAEAGTLLVLRTSPVDVSRARELLGITAQEGAALRTLASGEIFAMGLALQQPGPVRFHCRAAVTTHPEPGARFRVSPPPPGDAVRALLAELSDLPAEAPAEAAPDSQQVQRLSDRVKRLEGQLHEAQQAYTSLVQALDVAHAVAHGRPIDAVKSEPKSGLATASKEVAAAPSKAAPSQAAPSQASARSQPPGGGYGMMLAALAQHDNLLRSQLALIVGLSARGGTFAKYLSLGKTRGDWSVDGSCVIVTAEGRQRANDAGYEPLPVGAELLEFWCRHPRVSGKAKDMLRAIAAAGEVGVSREGLARDTGLEAGGGTFAKYLSTLRTLGLVSRSMPLKAAEELR